MLNFGAGKKKRKKEEKDRVVKKIGSFVDRLLLGFNDADVTRFSIESAFLRCYNNRSESFRILYRIRTHDFLLRPRKYRL